MSVSHLLFLYTPNSKFSKLFLFSPSGAFMDDEIVNHYSLFCNPTNKSFPGQGSSLLRLSADPFGMTVLYGY